MFVNDPGRGRLATIAGARRLARGLATKLMFALAGVALTTSAVATPVFADDGEADSGPLGGLLGGLLGGGNGGSGGLLGGVTGTIDEVLGGDLLGGDLLGGDLLGGDLLGGVTGTVDEVLGGDLLGGDLLGGDLLDGRLLDSLVGPDGLGVLKETSICIATCPDHRTVGVRTGLSGELLPGLLPEADAELCVPGPCANSTGDSLLNLDLATRGSELLPDAVLQACAAGDCFAAGRSGNGLALAHLGLAGNDVLPGLGLDACVVAVCEGDDYLADALLAGVLRLFPHDSILGGGLLGTTGTDVCLLGTCEHDGRYRSGVLTVDLISDDESLLPGVDGVVCLLAVCDRAVEEEHDQPIIEDDPGNGGGGGGDDGGPTTPPMVFVPNPSADPGGSPSGDAPADGGDATFPAAGFAPAADGGALGLLGGVERWPLAIAAMLAVAAAWFAGVRAVRRIR